MILFFVLSAVESDIKSECANNRFQILCDIAAIKSEKFFPSVVKQGFINNNDEALQFGQFCFKKALIQDQLPEVSPCSFGPEVPDRKLLNELFCSKWVMASWQNQTLLCFVMAGYFHDHNMHNLSQQKYNFFYDVYQMENCPENYKSEFFDKIEDVMRTKIIPPLLEGNIKQWPNKVEVLNVGANLFYAFNYWKSEWREEKEYQPKNTMRCHFYQAWMATMIVEAFLDMSVIGDFDPEQIKAQIAECQACLEKLYSYSNFQYKDFGEFFSKAIALHSKKADHKRCYEKRLIHQEATAINTILESQPPQEKFDIRYFEDNAQKFFGRTDETVSYGEAFKDMNAIDFSKVHLNAGLMAFLLAVTEG